MLSVTEHKDNHSFPFYMFTVVFSHSSSQFSSFCVYFTSFTEKRATIAIIRTAAAVEKKTNNIFP